jgi:protoheme IX farnesyltransferase
MVRAHLRSKIVAVREYLEVSKPRIVVVLVITAICSMLAASRFDNTPEAGWDISMWNLLYLIISGTMASMGSSALNHYYDRDIDKIMQRTSKRPIPSGKLLPRQVLLYGLLLCLASVSLAALTLNMVTASMIALGIFIYVVVYTIWLKRNNPSNIVIGGFAGSAASMAGWSAATGTIDLLGFLVGLLVFLWTPAHFWCLAIKAREEYVTVNVPMLPVLVGNQKTATYIFYNTAILLPYSLALYFFGLGVLYTIIAAVAGSLMLLYHYKLAKEPTPEFAWKAYKVTAPYLVVIFVGIALDSLFYVRF